MSDDDMTMVTDEFYEYVQIYQYFIVLKFLQNTDVLY